MPRVKKQTESSEEDKSKKPTKKSSKKESKRDNPEEEIVEDELSDVEFDESGKEGSDLPRHNDVDSKFDQDKTERVLTKFNSEILPAKGTPYEELDIVDHLNCVIKFAGETYNQDLRSDMLEIKRRITNNKRRPRSRSKNQLAPNFNRPDFNGRPNFPNQRGMNSRGAQASGFSNPRSPFGGNREFIPNNRDSDNSRSSAPFGGNRDFVPNNRPSRARSNSLTQRRPPMMEAPDIYNE